MTRRSPASTHEGVAWLRRGQRYLAPLLVRSLPREVPFGFLGKVAPASADVELFVEAHRIAAQEALDVVNRARAVTEAELASGTGGSELPEVEAERSGAEELGRAIADRRQELWRTGIRAVAHGTSRVRAEGERHRLAERLATLGFATTVPRFEVGGTLRPSGLEPEEARPPGYWQTLSTDALAALFPFADETILEPSGILVGLALADASPVFLDRWAHGSYSWGIFGTTGSGKSFAAALYALRTRWMRPETELLVLDPLGEYGRFVRAIGGELLRLADPDAGRLNPLDPRTTGGDVREKAARIGTMLRALFPTLTDEEAATLDASVSGLFDGPTCEPTFDELLSRVARAATPGRLPAFLEVFRTGSLRTVNGPTTVEPGTPVVGIDFSAVPDDHLAFHLSYVLDWTYARLRTRPGPKLVVLDEAHLLARSEATLEFLDRLVRHLRHFDAGMLLLTQNPDDLLARPSGRSLLRNLAATTFLRLPEVSEATRSFFQLGASEAEWLPKARLPREAGYSESLWRIGEAHLPLAIVGSTPEYEFLTALLGPPAAGASRGTVPVEGEIYTGTAAPPPAWTTARRPTDRPGAEGAGT
jgi:hypothetical protein